MTQAELSGRTTIAAAPHSAEAEVYRQLARRIAEHSQSKVPTPLTPHQLRDRSGGWADRLVAAEQRELA